MSGWIQATMQQNTIIHRLIQTVEIQTQMPFQQAVWVSRFPFLDRLKDAVVSWDSLFLIRDTR